MAKKKSNNARRGFSTPNQQQPNTTICDCTDCRWAHLVQYDAPRDPLLAECTKKPQPYSPKFPYAVEVARAKKLCPMYEHTDEARTPELRPKAAVSGSPADNKTVYTKSHLCQAV